jgi:hypothetical protein
MFILPRRGMNQSQCRKPITGRNPIKHKMDTRFFSRGSRACLYTSPRCVDQHLMVQQLRGIAQTLSTQLDSARTYPQVR